MWNMVGCCALQKTSQNAKVTVHKVARKSIST
jgi:hypothetical protein